MKMKKTDNVPSDGKPDDKHASTRRKLDMAVLKVVGGLPEQVQKELYVFWNETPFKGLNNEPYQAPRFFLACCPTGLSKKDGLGLMVLGPDGGTFLFGTKFVENAPSEVIEVVIALALADAYARAAETWSSGLARETDRVKIMSRWGFDAAEIVLWQAVIEDGALCPVEAYYARRFALFHRLPPASADLNKISKVLISEGLPDLAQQVLTLGNSQN